jgi:hypothetical protein
MMSSARSAAVSYRLISTTNDRKCQVIWWKGNTNMMAQRGDGQDKDKT